MRIYKHKKSGLWYLRLFTVRYKEHTSVVMQGNYANHWVSFTVYWRGRLYCRRTAEFETSFSPII